MITSCLGILILITISKFCLEQTNLRLEIKKTLFINPSSVGQPRNLNPCAKCGLLDTITTEYTHLSVLYDFKQEQALLGGEVDDFYRNHLTFSS